MKSQLKRLLSLLLCGAMLVGVTACNGLVFPSDEHSSRGESSLGQNSSTSSSSNEPNDSSMSVPEENSSSAGQDSSIELPDETPSYEEEILEGTEGVLYELSEDGSYAIVVGYEGEATDVVIASRYEDAPVTHIQRMAFFEHIELTSVTIPDSVTTIESYAFQWCDYLQTVKIGASVSSIDDKAFFGCENLQKVYIKDLIAWCDIAFLSNESNPLKYADEFYVKDVLITDLTLPNTIKKIQSRAFLGYSGLINISVPDSVTVIGSSAFMECTNLKTIVLPKNLTVIDAYLFDGCKSLESINIPESVTFIGNYAFRNCIRLTNVCLPESITAIETAAFTGCTNLAYNEKDGLKYLGTSNNAYFYLAEAKKEVTDATIDENCKIIGTAFKNCTNLTSVQIPQSVIYIGWEAFRGCTKLTNVTIPALVQEIEYQAFAECSALQNIEFKGTKAQWKAIVKGNYWNNKIPAKSVTCDDGEETI